MISLVTIDYVEIRAVAMEIFRGDSQKQDRKKPVGKQRNTLGLWQRLNN